MKSTLREENGKVYAVSRYTLENEPVIVESWYHLPNVLPGQLNTKYGADYRGDGYYSVLSFTRGSIFTRLSDGGNTKAEKQIRVDVPKPRTKRACIWNNAHWEKLTKKGWVIA